MLQKIILGVIGLFVVFIGVLYLLIRTSKKDVSKYAPFTSLVGNSVSLKRPVWLVRNREVDIQVNPFILTEPNEPIDDEAKLIRELPVGTKLLIERVLLVKNGVSGMQTALVVGTVSTPDESIRVEYVWGNYHSISDKQPYWTFATAIWQTQPDTRHYTLPNFWF